MSWIEAIVLGITQGLTEFLPISSSGHLIIVPWLFGWDAPGLAFDAALHLGTLVAVIAYFWRDLLAMVRAIPLVLRMRFSLLRTSQDVTAGDASFHARLALLIVVGSIPGGVVGLAAQSRIDDFFHSSSHMDRAIVVIAILLAAFALLLYAADRLGTETRAIETVGLRDAIVIGCAQAVALMPGVSRSGITLTAGLFRDLKRADAARFSFLLGVPLVTLAGLKGLTDLVRANPTGEEIGTIVLGMTASMISGFIAIWGLLRYLQRSSTMVFVIYRLLLSIALIVMVAAGFR